MKLNERRCAVINPNLINTADELAAQLDELRQRDGRSYQKLAAVSGLGVGTIHAMVEGTTFPRRDTLKLFVEACREDSKAWLEAWTRIRTELDRGVSGNLEQPQQDAEVGSYPMISGQVAGVPPENDLWIAVRRGPGGVFWPKEPKVRPDKQGRFKLSIIEEGPSGPLVISLLMVPGSRSREFDQWFKDGHETGRYPGISPENVDAELHSVSVRYHR